jgi:hypothetical protein
MPSSYHPEDGKATWIQQFFAASSLEPSTACVAALVAAGTLEMGSRLVKQYLDIICMLGDILCASH